VPVRQAEPDLPVPPTILRVGLTGNIAAGKSTVARWLEEFGCKVLDLDAIGHECLLPGTPTHDDVVATFGEAILRADGSVDRRALGTIVFSDGDARQRLEAILHPAIRELEEQRIEGIAEAGSGIVVTEAALLYETGAWERYDRMIVVVAPDDERRARLHAQGLPGDEIARRMASQLSQRDKAKRADYVVDNGGTPEKTRAATRVLAGRLRRDLVKQIAGQPLDDPGDER
jgi:dephospho-CoA kinase